MTLSSTGDERDYRRAAELRVSLLRFQRQSEEATWLNDLTPQRYLLLLLIGLASDAGDPLTVTALREPLQMTQSAVTQLVLGCEAAGLLTRRPRRGDGRSHDLHLTALGERRVRATFDALGEERARLIEAVGGLTPPVRLISGPD